MNELKVRIPIEHWVKVPIQQQLDLNNYPEHLSQTVAEMLGAAPEWMPAENVSHIEDLAEAWELRSAHLWWV